MVSKQSLLTLQNIMLAARVQSCKITSSVRTPQEQAELMYDNIVRLSVGNQKRLYGPAGDQVIAIYEQRTAQGASRSAVIQAMTDKINALGPGNVSHHCCDPAVLNVIDIAPSSIPADRRNAFLTALADAKSAGRISRFFSPSDGDPAFHIEIPQQQFEVAPKAVQLDAFGAGAPVLAAFHAGQATAARALRARFRRMPRRLRRLSRARQRSRRRS